MNKMKGESEWEREKQLLCAAETSFRARSSFMSHEKNVDLWSRSSFSCLSFNWILTGILLGDEIYRRVPFSSNLLSKEILLFTEIWNWNTKNSQAKRFFFASVVFFRKANEKSHMRFFFLSVEKKNFYRINFTSSHVFKALSRSITVKLCLFFRFLQRIKLEVSYYVVV